MILEGGKTLRKVCPANPRALSAPSAHRAQVVDTCASFRHRRPSDGPTFRRCPGRPLRTPWRRAGRDAYPPRGWVGPLTLGAPGPSWRPVVSTRATLTLALAGRPIRGADEVAEARRGHESDSRPTSTLQPKASDTRAQCRSLHALALWGAQRRRPWEVATARSEQPDPRRPTSMVSNKTPAPLRRDPRSRDALLVGRP